MASYAFVPESVLAAQWNGQPTPELDQVLAGTPFLASNLNRYGTIDGVIVAEGGDPIPLGSMIVHPPSSHEPYILPPARFNTRYKLV